MSKLCSYVKVSTVTVTLLPQLISLLLLHGTAHPFIVSTLNNHVTKSVLLTVDTPCYHIPPLDIYVHVVKLNGMRL